MALLPEWLCKIVTKHKYTSAPTKGVTQCDICGKTWSVAEPPKTDPVPVPQPKPEEKDAADTGDSAKHPKPVHGAMFNTDGCTFIQMGKGGMRVNPDNSKGRVKIIFSPKFEHKIARVTVWGGGGQWEPKIVHPHESPGNRERLYMPMSVSSTPQKLNVRFDCVIDGASQDYYTVIENSHEEIG